GATLYEMLAEKRPFQKPTSEDTMSAILNEDPPSISQVTTNTPLALQRVVHRCLEKSPEQRFQSASDLAFALEALSESSSSAAARSNEEPWRISKLWAVAAVLAAVVAVVLVLRFRTPPHPEQKHELVERQLTANPPESTVSTAAISRDGKYLAYGDYSNKLYLLAIDSGEIRQSPLPAPYAPTAWFPDGNHLLLAGGVFGGDLWKISTWDFSLRKLWGGQGGLAYLAAVSPDGLHIAFVKDDNEVWLMGADGDEPHKILASDALLLSGLAWSPSGQRLAYIRLRGTAAKRDAAVETCDLAGGARTVVLSDPNLWGVNGSANVAWVPDGRIIYSIFSGVTESNLWARIADPSTGKPVGDATRLAGWKNFEALDPQASTDGKRLIAFRQHIEHGIYIGDL